jgi:uncharacterized phage protein (TIGR02220 family)
MTLEQRIEELENRIFELELKVFKKKQVRAVSKVEDENHKELKKQIIDYTNQKLKTNYKYSTVKLNECINARIKEGHNFDDFKYVVDVKHQEWFGTDMAKYLRFDTLFGTKFTIYRNQKKGATTKAQLRELNEILKEKEQRRDTAIEHHVKKELI